MCSVELRARRGGDFDVNGRGEEADVALDLLRLLYGESDLVFFSVIRVGDVEFRSAGAVDPLLEEAVDVDVRGFFDGFDKIGCDDVFAAIDFEIVLDAAPEGVVAELMAEHVENPAAFAVSVVVEFFGLVEIATDDGFVVEAGAWRTSCAQSSRDCRRHDLCRNAIRSRRFRRKWRSLR